MKVKDLMTKKPSCATPDMDLGKIARMMADQDVGSIPVVENKDSLKVVGLVTDRDIATRAVAEGKNPLQMKAGDIMSSPVVTAKADDDVEEVARMMEKKKVRRIPVVDEQGLVMGMVAQADIARKAPQETTASVVQTISKPSRK